MIFELRSPDQFGARPGRTGRAGEERTNLVRSRGDGVPPTIPLGSAATFPSPVIVAGPREDPDRRIS